MPLTEKFDAQLEAEGVHASNQRARAEMLRARMDQQLPPDEERPEVRTIENHLSKRRKRAS